MSTAPSDDPFAFWEAAWKPLEPGTVVEYSGPMLAAHGLWVVRVQVGDDRYTLAHPLNEWERLNAHLSDLKAVDRG